MSLATKISKATSQGGMVGRVPYGDPGLWGAIGGAIKTVAKAGIGFVAGGPAGAVAATIPGLLGGGGPKGLPSNLPALPMPGVGGAIARALPGGSSGYVSAAPMRGYRLNKTGYWLKDGTYVPPQSRYVKSRRRNALNPRALSRAMARIESAKKASKGMSRITIRKKSCGC